MHVHHSRSACEDPVAPRRFARRVVAFRVFASVIVFVNLCRPGQAQTSQGPAEQTSTPGVAQPRPNPDFLFGRPRRSVGIRGGWLFARAGSDLFKFVQDQLTIDDHDFNAPALAVDLGFAPTSRTDVLLGFEFGRASTRSEYRGYVDEHRLPITQETRLRQMNVSGSLKFALTPRGREVSRLAWIPRTVTPYAGAGGGVLWYEFHQTGEFVDFVDLSIFSDTLRSSGWTPSAQVFGGVDVKVWRRLFFTGEARYLWSHADLRRDFSGFEPIDLAGTKVTAGVSYVF